MIQSHNLSTRFPSFVVNFDLLLIQHMVGPIQVARTLAGHIAVVATNLSRTQSRHAQSLYALQEICRPSAWLKFSRNRALLWFLSEVPVVPKQSPIQVLS